MNPIVAPVIKAVEAIAIWLNPERKEKAVLRNAIYAAKQIIAILDKTGEYRFLSDARRIQLRLHFQKQLDNWQDGQG